MRGRVEMERAGKAGGFWVSLCVSLVAVSEFPRTKESKAVRRRKSDSS